MLRAPLALLAPQAKADQQARLVLLVLLARLVPRVKTVALV